MCRPTAPVLCSLTPYVRSAPITAYGERSFRYLVASTSLVPGSGSATLHTAWTTKCTKMYFVMLLENIIDEKAPQSISRNTATPCCQIRQDQAGGVRRRWPCCCVFAPRREKESTAVHIYVFFLPLQANQNQDALFAQVLLRAIISGKRVVLSLQIVINLVQPNAAVKSKGCSVPNFLL